MEPPKKLIILQEPYIRKGWGINYPGNGPKPLYDIEKTYFINERAAGGFLDYTVIR
jgi:hypothetical protein